MSIYYDRQGKPIYDTLQWAKLLEDRQYKIVKQEHTPKKMYWVSTVWLGIDHDFSWRHDEPNPCPVIFETMVFDERPENQRTTEFSGDRTFAPDLAQERYTTEAEALEGHARLLQRFSDMEAVQENLTDDPKADAPRS